MNPKNLFFAVFASVATLGNVRFACAQALVPGYLTDPTAVRGAVESDESYQPPESFKYPYISTYYVQPTVTPSDDVKVGFFVTDFDSSKIRFLDESHRFTAFLEFRLKGGESKVITLADLGSGDYEFNLGKLPVGEYEMRVWAKDAKGRESHRVIHDFRVHTADDLAIPADKVYKMTEADLAEYEIRNDGDFEEIVYLETNGTSRVVKGKRAGVPGYTVTVPLDPKTGKLPWQAWKKAKVVYDAGYDKAAVAKTSVTNVIGLQKMLDEKAAAGFRKIVLLKGTYRLSHEKSLSVPCGMTLDLGGATLKQNGFTGERSCMVRLIGVTDAHLVGGTIEGDYWEHNYAGSKNNSEWPSGFEIGGSSQYCSVEDVKVVGITGYGGQNGITPDAPGGISFFVEGLPAFARGGLNRGNGEIDASDKFRFTTDFKDIKKIIDAGNRRLQVSRYLGYQGVATRSWQMTVAWYDAEKKFISAETAWQYREMWIPAGAAFLRVSVEAESADAADKSGLTLTAFRLPVNCTVARCTFDNCRCVGYAASAMKNMLFAENFFTQSGESAACCAFDAEDGWDQMQDVYFLKNVFRDNPRNNSILTCAGHNFILEKNDGDIYLWGRTHSPCVRGNAIGQGTYRCDSRLRSGYGRFDGNTYAKGVNLGLNESKDRTDNWDYVLSGQTFDGGKDSFTVDVGAAGRMVNCTFRNMPVSIANAYACTFENCKDASTYLPFPSGRWSEVIVKDSTFSRFYQSNVWVRCRFENTKLSKFIGGSLMAKDCSFVGTSLFGIEGAVFNMSGCTLDGATVQGNWWEKPADLMFKNCTITMSGSEPPLKLGTYTVGKIEFDGCEISGKGSLVDVKDLRPIQLPANVPAAENPDLKPGTIALRGTKWTSESSPVVSHAAAPASAPSQKKITIIGSGNEWPEGVVVATDLPASWELK